MCTPNWGKWEPSWCGSLLYRCVSTSWWNNEYWFCWCWIIVVTENMWSKGHQYTTFSGPLDRTEPPPPMMINHLTSSPRSIVHWNVHTKCVENVQNAQMRLLHTCINKRKMREQTRRLLQVQCPKLQHNNITVMWICGDGEVYKVLVMM